MGTTRAIRWGKRAGPLSGALFLHALLVGAAAVATFTVLPVRDEDATLAVSIAKHRPREPMVEAPRFAELETLVAESVDDDFAELDAHTLVETHWELPPEQTAPARAPELAPQVALDLAPLDFSSLDFGAFGGGTSESMDGAPGTGALTGAVASAGGGGRPQGSGSGGSGTSGTGTANEAAAGAPGLPSKPAPIVRAPELIESPKPAYPSLSRRAGEEGSVLCRLHVTAQGAVSQVDVVESSGFARLDESARTVLARWRFEPQRVDGRAEATTLLHRVTFRLD